MHFSAPSGASQRGRGQGSEARGIGRPFDHRCFDSSRLNASHNRTKQWPDLRVARTIRGPGSDLTQCVCGFSSRDLVISDSRPVTCKSGQDAQMHRQHARHLIVLVLMSGTVFQAQSGNSSLTI